jgi:hypothetical protein
MPSTAVGQSAQGSSSSLVGLGAGLGLIASAQLLPPAWVLPSSVLVPAVVMTTLWAVESRRAPAGWERNVYGVTAIITALLATLIVPVSLSVGPVAILCAAVASVSLVRRHLEPLAAAVVVLPLNVSGWALADGTGRFGWMALAGVTLVAAGAWAHEQAAPVPGAEAPLSPQTLSER